MAFQQQGDFSFNHVNQPDNLSGIMSADQIKVAFDSRALEVKNVLNKLVQDLNSTLAGTSGAKNVGASTINGVTGNDVQTLLANLKVQIDSKLGTSGGDVTGDINLGFNNVINFSGAKMKYNSPTEILSDGSIRLKGPLGSEYRSYVIERNNFKIRLSVETTGGVVIEALDGTDTTKCKLTMKQDGTTYLDSTRLDVNGRIVANGDVYGTTITENGTLLANKYALKTTVTPGTVIWSGTPITLTTNITGLPPITDTNGWILEWKNATGTAYISYSYLPKQTTPNTSLLVECGNTQSASYNKKVVSIADGGTSLYGNAANGTGDPGQRLLVRIITY